MINIRKYKNFYYVKGDDCYVFYSLFNYKINGNIVSFRSKKLSTIIEVLRSKNISFKVENYDYIFKSNNSYDFYISEGKKRFLIDKYVFNIKQILIDNINSRKFNDIYKYIVEIVDE